MDKNTDIIITGPGMYLNRSGNTIEIRRIYFNSLSDFYRTNGFDAEGVIQGFGLCGRHIQGQESPFDIVSKVEIDPLTASVKAKKDAYWEAVATACLQGILSFDDFND